MARKCRRRIRNVRKTGRRIRASLGVTCATCGCTGECQLCQGEEFNQIDNVPGPATGAIPKRSGQSSSRGQERGSASKEEKKARRRKKASTGSGGGGASATPEGPQEREIPQVPVTPAGGLGNREEGSPEGDSERERGHLQQRRGGAEGGLERGPASKEETKARRRSEGVM